MQAIHHTQSLNQQGDAVVNLHAALDTLGFGAPITQQERADHRYGDGTTVAVRSLQHDLGVHTEQHGVVDEPTAEAINRRLFELGVFHRVEGTLRLPDGGPSADTLIFAFDPEFIGGAQLGEATTSDDGFYRIFYDPTLYTRLGPGVDHIKETLEFVVFAYDGAGTTIASSDRHPEPPSELWVDLVVGELRFAPEPAAEWVVHGIVVDTGGPAVGVTVTAYDRAHDGTLRRLGEDATTDAEGGYRIPFTSDEFRGPNDVREHPDLFVRVFQGNQVLGESDTHRAETNTIRIDVRVRPVVDDANAPLLLVFGTVRDEWGEPLDGVLVQAFDRDLRHEEELGRAPVRAGRYEIPYRRSQFRRAEKQHADLVLAVLDPNHSVLYRTAVLYNAPEVAEVNISLGGAEFRGPSEWDVLTRTLMPLLEDVRPQELREDDEFQDISFLSGESGRSQLVIGTWVMCHRLEEKTHREETPLEAAVFFAFMRQGQPALLYDTLLDDVKHPDRVALLEEKILRELAAIGEGLQRSLLQRAVEENLVPARLGAQIEEILATLVDIRLRFARDTPFGAGKGTVGQLLALVPAAQQQEATFMNRLLDHTGPIDEFWKGLETDQVFAPEVVKDVRLTFELSELARNHVPLVHTVKTMLADGELRGKRDLARYSRQEWKQLFERGTPDGTPVGVPENIDGEGEEERKEHFAAILEERFERAYPTAAFGARLQRAEASPVRARDDMARFIDNNPSFLLDRYRVDHYIAAHPEALADIEDPEGMVRELKAVQRVFKLNPKHAVVDALMANGIDSAQQVYFMGPAQFTTAMEGAGVNRIEAKKMYAKAENAYALALNLFGSYNVALNGPSPATIPTQTLDEETQALVATLPNLQTLFGSLDYCECSHCESVYSPAAHFVDILRFLGERGTQGTGVHAGKNVRQVLLERRSDLGEIELSCENTNTPLPYIDLVNELLEDMVSPPKPVTLDAAIEPDLVPGAIRPAVLDDLAGKGVAVRPDAEVYAPDSRAQWAIRDREHAYKVFKENGDLRLLATRQTFLSAPELRANPEYTNRAAYDKLAGEVFPLNLPFDLWSGQARTYLGHLGVPLPRLFKLFGQTLADGTRSPSELQTDTAWLGLTETERQILTGTLPGKQPWDYWGLAETGNDIPHPATPTDATANVTGTWVKVLGHVDVVLHRAGIGYRDLLQLLDTRYVNPTGSLTIEANADPNAANCDTSTYTIGGLTADALNRMQRFIRLWRGLGSPMWEVDMLLPGADPDPAVSDKQITDAALQAISRMKRLRERLGLEWRVVYSLYHDLDHNIYFDRLATGGPAVQTLYQRLFRNRLVDAVAAFPEHPSAINGTIADHVPGILAAFRIKEADLTLILEELNLVPTDALDWTVLSRIYRVTALAKALNLTVDHFRRSRRLWGQDPFADAAATLEFVALADAVARSGFTVLELDYLLAHEFTPSSGVALEDRAVVALLEATREGMQKISDDLRLKSEETAEDYVRARLGRLPVLARDADQAEALALVEGSWDVATADRNALLDRYFAGVMDPVETHTRLAAIAGGLSPADRQVAVNARFEYVQGKLEAFLLRAQQEAFLLQQVGDGFGLAEPTATVLLTGVALPGGTTPLLQTLNAATLLRKLPDGSYEFAITEPNFPDLFKALRLVHKNALLLGKVGALASDLAWWLDGTHAADMAWVAPGQLPTDTTAPVAFEQWQAARDFFAWKEKLPPSDLTPFGFLDAVLDGAVSAADTIAALAKLTTWSPDDITALVGAFRWNVKQEFRNPASLRRLSEAMAALRRLGVNAERAIAWAKPALTAADAEALKQTVKAKYDLTQWQRIIQPIQDEFRERKRSALVAWLVSHPNAGVGQTWTDPNGLYGYLLIDVEMSACMLTSRLKQATASVQLFVQRCLLNAEVDILAKTDLDPKWKQWKWMRYYRVWEANRKVFLYPENWIEPELRDEKSPFFKDLENELLQNDINQETVEQAYLNYLEKLDKVANLEIRAMTNQVISQNESVLHVIGRTRNSQAPEHFYRRRLNGDRWTAWEKVELEIGGNHLVIGIHNRRLYLLWPQFMEKAEEPATAPVPSPGGTATIPPPNRFWEVRLFWSELKKGKWTPKVLSDAFDKLSQFVTGGPYPQNVMFRVRNRPYIDVRQFYTSKPTVTAPFGMRGFHKIGASIDVRNESTSEDLIAAPNAFFYYNLQRNETKELYFFHNSFEEEGKSHAINVHKDAESLFLFYNLLGPAHMVLDSRAHAFEPAGSFFFWDAERTYFADYTYRRYTESTTSIAWSAYTKSTFHFYIHYHPFVELFIKELNIWGLKGLLNRRIQVDPASVPGSPPLFNFNSYKPAPRVRAPRPVEDVDFSYTGAYSPYNWELFFHVPFFIANKLSANQRFEEALEWFHFIFDPTSTDTAVANPETPQQKYWITKPFYETTKADYYKQKIENIMLAIAQGDAALRAQVAEWRDNPFNPHLIARMRTVAYQKNVLIKYIQTLIAWGDQLFRRDTIETLNEATQLYILAAAVLGPRPKSVPQQAPNPVMTYYQLEQEGVDDFGNALKEIENLLPTASSSSTMGDDTPELPYLNVLYFGIPNNEKLLALWDTVDDRLIKIRHCMNIEGVVRQLPLFEPPIDPALLVRAVAAGLDLGSVLSDMSAPMPLYRFTFMVQRAQELCVEVKALGAALLSALEKKDAEVLARLRSSHALIMLDEIKKVKESAIEEALRSVESLRESRKLTEERERHYQKLISSGLNTEETVALVLTGLAMALELAGTVLNLFGSSTSLIPDVDVGAAGVGGSPTVKLKVGGKNVSHGFARAAEVVKGLANIAQMGAGMSTTLAGYKRRAEDWQFQKQLATLELPMIDKQIAAAEIRHRMAERELANHEKQKEHAEKEGEYLRSKWTNQELYDWMIAQLSTIYFQSYQLAYDAAKRAERCFRYELGLGDSGFIQFGYWDSLNKGLLAGEKLYHDLKRLEMAYYEQNRRGYELTKHVSLAQLDPVALLKLRQTGECLVELPETAFDMDYPGHYFRRIKSVALSIPSVTGPFTTVACTLTLASNRLRKDATLLAGKYERDTNNPDPRFRDEVAAIQSIATSDGQRDSGMWELHFRDERYLPFEGAGAISTWHLKLNKDFPQWDYSTIADVIIHLNYTAREGGELLRSKAVEEFHKKLNAFALADSRQGLYRVFDLKREYSDKWYRFLHPAMPADDQALVLDDLAERLPYFTRRYGAKKVRGVEVVAQMADGDTYKVMLSPLGAADADLLTLTPAPTYGGLHLAIRDLTGNEANLGTWTLKLKKEGVDNFRSLPAEAIDELFLIIQYTVA